MLRFHKEGKTSIALVVLLSAGITTVAYIGLPDHLMWLKILAAIFALTLIFFILQFFRNPRRDLVQTDDHLVYVPADGKVVVIEEVEESEYLKERCLQVSIFMSPLNVHVNRNPVNGQVLYSQYHPGKFLMAWNPKASTENERTTIAYKAANGQRLVMRQIAGFLARRIVNYLKTGDRVVQGEDMGFIKLGSRVDVLLPLDAEVQVKLGDVVRGNKQVLARLK